MDRVYLCLAHMSGKEQAFIQEAFDTNWVVPLGPNVNGFEQDLEQWTGHDKRVVALSAGTAAIHLGLKMLGVGPGDEVICQSFTFAASVNPVVYLGARPVFVDSEAGTWNMDPDLLVEALEGCKQRTGRLPRAIVLVYLYGMPAYTQRILEIAEQYGVPVLEDAAEALGSRINGQPLGTFGQYGVMSFNGNKMITTSGGGALICPDDEAKKRVMFFATQAREAYPYYQHEEIGYNYRMSNICAGIGRGQMTVLDDHIQHHRWVQQQYREGLSGVPGLTLHEAPEAWMEPNFWLCTITLDDKALTGPGSRTNGTRVQDERDPGLGNAEPHPRVLELMKCLDEAGIESRPLWKPMHLQPVYRDAVRHDRGVSLDLFRRGLCLPAGPYVGEAEIQRIVSTIKKFMGV